MGTLTAFFLCTAGSVVTVGGQEGGQSQPGQQQQQPPAQDKDKQPNPAPLSMD